MPFLVDYIDVSKKDENINLGAVHPSAGAQSAVGQSFTVDGTCRITSAKFYILNSNVTSGTIKYKIYKQTGTHGVDSVPTGNAIATSEGKDITTLANPAAWELIELDFSPTICLTAGHYCIVLVIDSAVGIGGGNFIGVGSDKTPTHSGNNCVYLNSAWSVYSIGGTIHDVIFYVYGEYITGKFHTTKEDLIAAIQTAIPEGTVEGSWREHITEVAAHLPFIYVRMSPENITDVYDRNVGNSITGSPVDDHFTIHIFHSNCNVDGCEHGHFAQDVATRITDYLAVSPSPVGWDINDLSTRESEPAQGNQRISRVIIEGTIHILRID